jgi:DNA-binding Lrp family transcriptional regulator
VSPRKHGKNTEKEVKKMESAFVFINTEPASMPEVLKKVRAIEGVEEAAMVYGVYDIVAKVKAETMDQLKHIITHKVRTLANVRTTQTFLVIQF